MDLIDEEDHLPRKIYSIISMMRVIVMLMLTIIVIISVESWLSRIARITIRAKSRGDGGKRKLESAGSERLVWSSSFKARRV